MAKSNIEKKKKRKKIKISYTKIFIWIALIAMIFSAVAAIISPLFYN